MYEVLTSQQPYFDVGMGTKELIDLIGNRTIPLVSSKRKEQASNLIHYQGFRFHLLFESGLYF